MASAVYPQEKIAIPNGEYEIVANVVLPNLQDSLTKTTARQILCRQQHPANAFFPLLKHPSFTGCSLSKGVVKQQSNTGMTQHSFQLNCENKDAATGTATFEIKHNQFSARLKIKMGAKNMTMTQHLKAHKVAPC